ncbi:MAG: hypothetical protein HC880_18920 [Bacteroidia bacterium]|nr:hypothetical protein [Bacteroidia bacterium]
MTIQSIRLSRKNNLVIQDDQGKEVVLSPEHHEQIKAFIRQHQAEYEELRQYYEQILEYVETFHNRYLRTEAELAEVKRQLSEELRKGKTGHEVSREDALIRQLQEEIRMLKQRKKLLPRLGSLVNKFCRYFLENSPTNL